MTYEAQRLEICQVGKLLYDRGYVVSNDGNLSLRVAPDRLLVTPSGVGKGRMTPDMLVVTDLERGDLRELAVEDGGFHRSYFLVRHRSKYLTDGMKRVIRVLREHLLLPSAGRDWRRRIWQRRWWDWARCPARRPLPCSPPTRCRKASAPICRITTRCCWQTTAP